MFKRLLLGFGILGAAASTVALSMTWVVVSVVIAEDNLRLWIPAPVMLVHRAATLINPPELHKQIPFEREHARMAAAVLAELENVEDAELVRVESEGQLVVIRKEGGRIRIEVDDDEEHVRVHAPIREIREFLEDCKEGPIEPERIFQLARNLPSGPLVEFSEPGTQVSVRVW